MSPNKKHSFINETKYYLSDTLSQSKIKLIVTAFVLFVSLMVGIILAVKYNKDLSMNLLEDYGIVSFVGKGITSSFFSRLLSICLVMLILFACSFSKFLFPFAIAIMAFRTYLLGFNLCLMFLTYGLPGIFLSLFIILPCQLFILFALCFYYFLLCKPCYDRCDRGIKFKVAIFSLLIMAVLCLSETLILLVFNASIIIVI